MASIKQNSDSSAEKPVAPPGSAARSASLPLRELSKRSEFGAWTVVVRQAQADEYEYQWEGQKRSGKTFSCILVSSDDPSEYCMGQMRWTKKEENKFRSIQKQLIDGLVFLMMRKSPSSTMPRSSSSIPPSKSLWVLVVHNSVLC